MKFRRLGSESYKLWGTPGDFGIFFTLWIFPAAVKALKANNLQIFHIGNKAGGHRSLFDNDE